MSCQGQLRSSCERFPVDSGVCGVCMSMCDMVVWVLYAVQLSMFIVSEVPALHKVQLSQRLDAHQNCCRPFRHIYDIQRFNTGAFGL